jgi:glutamate-1-semialdehyde 2,1-aminomutase
MAVETTTTSASAIDKARIAALTEREMAKLAQRTPASKERYERAVKVMPKGVPSSFQESDPWPVYVERASASP